MDDEAMRKLIMELEEKWKASEIKCAELRGVVKSTSERIVIKSKPDTKVPKFNEKGDIEDWMESIRSHLISLSSHREQVDFVMNHLDPKPYREVRLRIDRKKATVEEVFDILTETFGVSRTELELYEEFYMRSQQNDETIDEYAYALIDLVIAIESKHHKTVDDADEMLKGRFAKGVSNINLKHELCRLKRDKELLSFTEIRERARIWLKEHDETTTSLLESTSVETIKWREVKQCLMEQQEQIKQLTLSQESSRIMNHGRGQSYNNRSHGARGYNSDRGHVNNYGYNNSSGRYNNNGNGYGRYNNRWTYNNNYGQHNNRGSSNNSYGQYINRMS
jgi:hypothetical protein